MNVTPLIIPVQRRTANKLSCWKSSAKFMAIVDVMADIVPRRTTPPAFDAIISQENQVFVILVDSENEEQIRYVGQRVDFEANLRGLAEAAGLSDEERAWLAKRVEEFTVSHEL